MAKVVPPPIDHELHMNHLKDDALFSAHAVVAALRSSIRVLRWGMLALVLVYLASGITVIKPNEVGLILRFGKVLSQVHQPGLLFAFPQPIDTVVLVPTKTVEEIALEEWAFQPGRAPQAMMHPVRDPYTLTGDANIVQGRFSARYQVADPIAYLFAAKDREALCRAILYDAVCKTLAGMSVEDVLTTRRDFIADETMRRAQSEVDLLGLGIHFIAFQTREISPPPQILPAFQDVVSARVEAKTLIEPANAYRASAIPGAKSKAYQIAQEAAAYSQQVVAKAQGEAASFVALAKEQATNPALVQSRLYTEMLEEVLPKLRLTTVMPDSRGQVRLLISPQQAAGEYTNEDQKQTLPRLSFPLGSPSQSSPPEARPGMLQNNEDELPKE
jgi:modulator of FtsH protease HflK